MDEKRWFSQTTEYYEALKRNELLSHEKIQRTLKCVSVSERVRRDEMIGGITDSMGMSLSKLQELGRTGRPGVPRPWRHRESDRTERLN